VEHMGEKSTEMMKETRRQTAQTPEGGNPPKNNLRQSAKKGVAVIDGKTIEFVEKSLLGNKIKIRLPQNFKKMSPETAALKYPFQRRPDLIYSNESFSVNITFKHSQNPLKETDIDIFKDAMIQILKKTHPTAPWLEDGVKEINGKKIGCVDSLYPFWDIKIYSLMFFTELENKALLCSFNCTEEEMADWRPVAVREIMESLIIGPENLEGVSP